MVPRALGQTMGLNRVKSVARLSLTPYFGMAKRADRTSAILGLYRVPRLRMIPVSLLANIRALLLWESFGRVVWRMLWLKFGT